MAMAEGTVPFRGFRTWYQVVGELPAPDGKLPLLVVNGGPGCPHDYLQDLAPLADESGRPVVFYDQLGCGRSDQPDDPALWVMATFVEEVAAVREALGLDRVHLLGHSWGTQVALEYVLGRPAGLVSLVLASPLASAPVYAAEARRLKESLPPEVQEVIDRHEAATTPMWRPPWPSTSGGSADSIRGPITSCAPSPACARRSTGPCGARNGTLPAT